MSQNWQADVLEFSKAFGQHIGAEPSVPSDDVVVLRSDLIQEEVQETIDALERGDLVEVADGIADSIVVLLGTAIALGIDMQPVWDEVHRTNMAKIGGPRRPDGKQLKPVGWTPPDIAGVLARQKERAA